MASKEECQDSDQSHGMELPKEITSSRRILSRY